MLLGLGEFIQPREFLENLLPHFSISTSLPASGTHGHLKAARAFKWHGMTLPRTGTWARPPAPLSPLLQVIATLKPHVTVICTQESTHTLTNVLLLDSYPPLPTNAISGLPASWTQKLLSQTHRKRPNRDFVWFSLFVWLVLIIWLCFFKENKDPNSLG